MADSNESAPVLPSPYPEICASLSMQCHKCDNIAVVERFYYLDKLKNQRLCINLLVRSLCEFHPRSSWSFYVWNRLTSAEVKNKTFLMKVMYTLGKSSPNSSAFNLYIGCTSQCKFFESFSLPATIPEFASQLVLSRTCTVSVSWEKICQNWKRH